MELVKEVTDKAILVVDDEEPIRWSLARSLRREGYRVLTAQNGAEALRIVQQEAPDLVLLDLRLPDIHGLEVLRTIKAGRGQPPVIILTASGDEEERQAALEAGAYDYIAKPFNLEELKGAIAAALAQPRSSGRPGPGAGAGGPR